MFNDQAEEAIKLYTSLFEDSEILTMVKYDEDGPGTPGSVQHSIFTLNGQVFMAIDANNGEEKQKNLTIKKKKTIKNTMEKEHFVMGLKKEGTIQIP